MYVCMYVIQRQHRMHKKKMGPVAQTELKGTVNKKLN